MVFGEDKAEAVADVDDADDELFGVAQRADERDAQRRQAALVLQDLLVRDVERLKQQREHLLEIERTIAW